MPPEPLAEAHFGIPGPLRDKLVAAVLAGTKTSTTSLHVLYELEDEPLPRIGERKAVLDSAGQAIAEIEVTEVRMVRLADIDDAHAVAEGEGFATAAEWRAAHEGFWNSAELRQALDRPDFSTDDDTLVVLETFQLV